MSELVLLLALALTLLGLLWWWARREAQSELSGRDLATAREILQFLNIELPPRVLAERVFSREDKVFVSRRAPRDVQRLFERDRARLALLWLGDTRAAVKKIVDLYRKVARHHTRVRLLVESNLAFDYLVFLVLCRMMQWFIWLRGPFAAGRLLDHTLETAENISLCMARFRREDIRPRRSEAS